MGYTATQLNNHIFNLGFQFPSPTEVYYIRRFDMTNQKWKHMVTAALCLALCLVLPFLTGQIPQIGGALAPMHLPVLLAGFLCGPWWALAIGLIAPPLRFILFTMPPFPVYVSMAFELAAYGLVSGILYRKLPKKTGNIYVSLISAMLVGRGIWGIAMTIITGLKGNPFGWAAFISGAFLNAIPGIVLQIVLIPILVMALRKVGYFQEQQS